MKYKMEVYKVTIIYADSEDDALARTLTDDWKRKGWRARAIGPADGEDE